jgi:hypothetical protein
MYSLSPCRSFSTTIPLSYEADLAVAHATGDSLCLAPSCASRSERSSSVHVPYNMCRSCSFDWKDIAESTIRWFIVRKTLFIDWKSTVIRQANRAKLSFVQLNITLMWACTVQFHQNCATRNICASKVQTHLSLLSNRSIFFKSRL